MDNKAMKNILELNENDILNYILKNPGEKNQILKNLKSRNREKFFKVSSDLKSASLNKNGIAATKVKILESVTIGKSIVSLDVNLIQPNPAQPRVTYEQEELEKLSDSIKEHGLLQPISVSKDKDGNYILIAGERRLRAHKLANIAKIEAIVMEVDELESRKLAIIENLHRSDLIPMEEGLSFKHLQLENNYSLREIGKIIGKSKNYVAARLLITKFNNDCIKFILGHRLDSITMLSQIVELKETLHLELLEKLSKGTLLKDDLKKYQVEKVEQVLDEVIEEPKDTKPKDVDHDKFNDDDVASKGVENFENDTPVEVEYETTDDNSSSLDEDDLIKESKSFTVKGKNKDILKICINTKTITSNEIDALKEYLDTL